MDSECHSIEEDVEFASRIEAHDTIAFCYPVHGSRVPRILREFVARHMEQLQDKQLIILCTQLIFSGDGARVFTDMFCRNYVQVLYAEHILMPNNVCNLFILPLSKEAKQKECVAKAHKTVQRICDEIKSRKTRKRGFNPASRVLGLIQGVFYPAFERKGLSRVWMDEDCTKCLLCVSNCPMHNIRFENDEIVTAGNCTICARCINACPNKAIAVYLHTKVKKQYHGVPAIL